MELGNHLGNVLTVISDRNKGVSSGGSLTLPDEQIIVLNNEGVGVSSISRILSIFKVSVQRRIERMKKNKPKPVFTVPRQVIGARCRSTFS